ARLNGWQRLWFVGSICFGLWLGQTLLVDANKHKQWDHRRSLERDFANPVCRDYQTHPMDALRKPAFNEACYHIYVSRQYDSTVSYTLGVYDRNSVKRYLMLLGFGIVGWLTVSWLVYFVGW